MARPEKQGIPYFSFDVDFFSDIKIKKIMRACGPKSIPVLVNLLCNIYRDKGYYIEWDDEIGFLVADEVGANESTAEEVVNKCLQVGFFDKSIFEKYKILTSKGIQKRYQKATYQRKNNAINPDLLLLEHEKRGYSHEKHMNNSVNHIESTQSKVKESKVNKSKVNKNKPNNTDVLFEEFFKVFTDSHPKNFKKRAEALNFFVRELSPLEREQAVIGAKNYIKTRERDGENPSFGSNPAVFLESMEFKEYQEIPPIPEKAIKKLDKPAKGLPSWSSLNSEPKEVEADW